MAKQKIIRSGSRSIVINCNHAAGPFWANLYVNGRDGDLGDITPVRARRASLASLEAWANRELAK